MCLSDRPMTDIMLRVSTTLKEFREVLAEVKAKLDRLAL